MSNCVICVHFGEVIERDQNVAVECLASGENISDIVIQFFFSDDSEDAGVRIFDIVKVPEMKSNKMIKVINDLNNKYRFAKFCLDTKDDTIQLEIDLIFRQHDIGVICMEAMLRALRICDDSYPELMKELWA